MDVELLVLNYNGRRLLEECLPSLLAAAARSRHACRVSIVDNGSTDDSLPWLADHYPQVPVHHCVNEGLCSFNRVLAASTAPVSILLNNDIRLAEDAIDPWVAPFESQLGEAPAPSGTSPEASVASDREHPSSPCFLAAPLCWHWDGRTLEGFQTAVRWRWGLVQATGRFTGAESICHRSGETAAAGAAIAVDRQIFLHLGGFDARYLPGRIEDLDFAFRGYMAGYRAVFVPAAVAWHRGAASFGPEFGDAGCLRLAYRNTLLFQWRHLRHPAHRLRQLVGIPLRVAVDICRAPVCSSDRRFLFTKALRDALRLHHRCAKDAAETSAPNDAVSKCEMPESTDRNSPNISDRRERLHRERAYFRRFHPTALLDGIATDMANDEARRERRHPISRWYLLPALNRIAGIAAKTAMRPWQVTVAGLVCILAAVAILVAGWTPTWCAAALVWLAWCCDRVDGKLARWQGTATPQGAWLDANVDELSDLAIHAAMAWAASAAAFAAAADALRPADLLPIAWPWLLVSAFFAGKYLLFYGQHEACEPQHSSADEPASGGNARLHPAGNWLRLLYHLPGNADIRWHIVVIALAGGWLEAALLYAACYFNVRWILRAVKRLSLADAPRAAREPSHITQPAETAKAPHTIERKTASVAAPVAATVAPLGGRL